MFDTVTHIVRVIILKANSDWSKPKIIEIQNERDFSVLSFLNQISYSIRKAAMKVMMHESKDTSLIICSVCREFKKTYWWLSYNRPLNTKIVMPMSSKTFVIDRGKVVLTRARMVMSKYKVNLR